MILITLSTDRNIIKAESAVRERMISYGPLFDCTHIVLVSKGRPKAEMLSGNVSVTTTGGLARVSSLARAFIILCQTVNSCKKENKKIVVSSQDPFEQGLVCFFAAKITGVKLHLQVHTDLFSPFFSSESILQKIRVKIARFLLPRADGVRVVSARIASSFQKEGILLKKEADILPVFVDVEKIKTHVPLTDLHKKYPHFEKIILMLSRFEKEKNISLGIEAFSQVLKKFSHVGLVLVGDGKECDALKKKVEELGIENNVVFEGWTNDPISYLKTADIFLNTSRYEGYGMVFVQAAAAGISILSTDVGIAREVGSHIISSDVEDVVRALCTVLGKEIVVPNVSNGDSKAGYLLKYKEVLESI